MNNIGNSQAAIKQIKFRHRLFNRREKLILITINKLKKLI